MSSRVAYRSAFRLMAVFVWCVLSPLWCGAAELDPDALFDPGRLLEVEITLPEEDWDQLRRQTRFRGGFGAMFGSDPADKPFTYFKGDVTIDGVAVGSVGVRKKGFFGSLDETRPSLKIKFDKYVDQDPAAGLDKLTLNNNKQDASVLSQLLAYRVFNDAGVHAPRCSLALVKVNGRPLGVYSNVESVTAPFLKARFGDDSGALYEGTVVDFHPRAVEKLEAKTDQENRADAKRLAELLEGEGGLPVEELSTLVDIDQFLRFWAVESLLGFWDGYTQDQNNYFVYDDPSDGRYRFIPWGADVCFTTGGGPFARMGGGRHSEAVHAAAMLPNRLYHSDGIPARYKQAMLNVLASAWEEEQLLAEVDRVEQLVDGQLHEDQLASARSGGWGIQPLTTDRVREFIKGRREVVMAELEDGPVEVAKKPRVPMHTVEVGAASGSFTTHWSDDPNAAQQSDQLKLALTLNGEEVTLEEAGVVAQPLQMPRFGPPGPSDGPAPAPPATIEVRGRRASDDQRLTLTLVIDRDALAAGKTEPIRVSGSLREGAGQFGFPGQMLTGTLTLTSGGTNEGDEIAGAFEAEIVEMRGGMFDGMRGGPR
ncbi:Inner spore coat protein H [Posidoniimonas corsicana]|uniref:Inner spore coat protein H n=1 Tax=Posidoniimonas corsicana TaxID=1938618 RepID=A0A5C5UXT0_9BACT|nr:CotH kinase family protein [Posidoniimonas corsicana]TWT30453.1 Inner spore coat protein H [Posidoniimonas corsicana]